MGHNVFSPGAERRVIYQQNRPGKPVLPRGMRQTEEGGGKETVQLLVLPVCLGGKVHALLWWVCVARSVAESQDAAIRKLWRKFQPDTTQPEIFTVGTRIMCLK